MKETPGSMSITRYPRDSTRYARKEASQRRPRCAPSSRRRRASRSEVKRVPRHFWWNRIKAMIVPGCSGGTGTVDGYRTPRGFSRGSRAERRGRRRATESGRRSTAAPPKVGLSCRSAHFLRRRATSPARTESKPHPLLTGMMQTKPKRVPRSRRRWRRNNGKPCFGLLH